MNVRTLSSASRDGHHVTLVELSAMNGPIVYVLAAYLDVDPMPRHSARTTLDRGEASEWYDALVLDVISPEVGETG